MDRSSRPRRCRRPPRCRLEDRTSRSRPLCPRSVKRVPLELGGRRTPIPTPELLAVNGGGIVAGAGSNWWRTSALGRLGSSAFQPPPQAGAPGTLPYSEMARSPDVIGRTGRRMVTQRAMCDRETMWVWGPRPVAVRAALVAGLVKFLSRSVALEVRVLGTGSAPRGEGLLDWGRMLMSAKQTVEASPDVPALSAGLTTCHDGLAAVRLPSPMDSRPVRTLVPWLCHRRACLAQPCPPFSH